MIELDDRLLTLQKYTQGWGAELRTSALEADGDPVQPRALDSMAVSYLRRTIIPPELNIDPPVLEGYRFYGMTAIERVIAVEEFAWGDAGTMLAAPGPSLSGVLINKLGDTAQKELFYGRVQQDLTWTFFALTEQSGGSDAGRLSTTLTQTADAATLNLTGSKRYVGNAARAQLGTVFARTRPGPLGVTAVLIDTADPGYKATTLEMIGLRGAQICAIELYDVAVSTDRVLGRHLTASARGMWGAVQTFNQLRPGVAAIALGIARAASDYATTHRRELRGAERESMRLLQTRLHGVRQLVYAAAHAVDIDPRDGYLGSAAKARATQLAEDATMSALALFGPGARLEHPLLDKLSRDARGVEFMEGTSNIQRLNVSQGVTSGKLGRV